MIFDDINGKLGMSSFHKILYKHEIILVQEFVQEDVHVTPPKKFFSKKRANNFFFEKNNYAII